MSGREFVREIPVELPEQETQHDVLATLWARRRVDDLMGQDMNGMQSGNMRDDLKSEIVNLGLTYRMMTQFTSFVAVEDTTTGDGVEPRRVDVPVEAPAESGVSLGSALLSSHGIGRVERGRRQLADQATVTTRATQELPLQGRSLQVFLLLTPGAACPGPAEQTSVATRKYFGERTPANLEPIYRGRCQWQLWNCPGRTESGRFCLRKHSGANRHGRNESDCFAQRRAGSYDQTLRSLGRIWAKFRRTHFGRHQERDQRISWLLVLLFRSMKHWMPMTGSPTVGLSRNLVTGLVNSAAHLGGPIQTRSLVLLCFVRRISRASADRRVN